MGKFELPTPAITGTIGGVLGGAGAIVQYFTAQAAVEVRPALANASLLSAKLTNHASDWLFFNFPVVMGILSVIGGVVAGVIAGLMITVKQ